MRSSLQNSIHNVLHEWKPSSAEQIRYKQQFLAYQTSEYCSRENTEPGHFTASGFVRTRGFEHICLIFHPRFQKWIQPGGHLDETDEHILEAAKREVEEETGLGNIEWDGTIRLDVHHVPTTSKQKAHLHFDIQFGFIGPFVSLSGDVRGEWISWGAFEKNKSDASVCRFLEKWQ